MQIYKIIIFFLIGSVAITLVSLLWQKPLILIGALLILALAKHLLSPIKQELILYLLSGFFGTVVESLIMQSGAWQYAQPHLFNIPLWLPFLWGITGTSGITLYQGLVDSKR